MTKKELRKLFLEKRKSLLSDTFQKLNEALIKNASEALDYQNKFIHIFLTIQKHREPDTFELKRKIESKNKGITWVLSKSNFKDLSLQHFIWNVESKIEKNQFDIPEPIGGIEVPEEKLDIVFVPLLLADKKGFRIGYGKGFYDRFLSKCKKDCIKIGLSVFEPIETIQDLNEFDIALDYIVSPEQILKIA